MTEFTSTDVKIIASMSLAVILISLTLPHTGLANTTVGNPPQLNVSDVGFDFGPKDVGSLDGVLAENSGTIRINSTETNRSQWMVVDKSQALGENNDGDILYAVYGVYSTVETDGSNITVSITEYGPATTENTVESTPTSDSTVVKTVSYNVTEGESVEYSNNGYTARMTLSDVTRDTSGNVETVLVGFSADKTTTGIFDQVSVGVGAIAQTIGFLVGSIFSFLAEAATYLALSIAYVFKLISYLITGYGSVVSAAPAVVSLVLTIPLVLLSLEIVKILLMVVNIIWIG